MESFIKITMILNKFLTSDDKIKFFPFVRFVVKMYETNLAQKIENFFNSTEIWFFAILESQLTQTNSIRRFVQNIYILISMYTLKHLKKQLLIKGEKWPSTQSLIKKHLFQHIGIQFLKVSLQRSNSEMVCLVDFV